MSAPLQKLLSRRAEAYRDALDRLRDDAEPDAYGDRGERTEVAREEDVRALREAIEVVHCARRMLEGKTVREAHAAFGSPGDFGYDTEFGDTLARIYRGEVSA